MTMDKDKLSRLEAVRRQDTGTPNYQWPTFRESGPLEHFGQIGIAFTDADEALSKVIGDHADDVQRLEDNKADKTALQALQTAVNGKADSSTVTTLSNAVANKVSKTTIASLADDADLPTVVAKVNQILSALK